MIVTKMNKRNTIGLLLIIVLSIALLSGGGVILDNGNNAYAAIDIEEKCNPFVMRNLGFLEDGFDLNTIHENAYYLLASSRTYINAPYTEGLLITTLNGTSDQFCVIQRMYELTSGANAYRYKAQNGWTKWFYTVLPQSNYRIGMFGDSITWGSIAGKQTQKGIPFYVWQETGFETVNLGVGSQGWVVAVNGENGLDHIRNTDISGYDIITAMYGVNDWNAPLGSYLDTAEGTIMGNIYNAYMSVMERNPGAIFILISFTNTSNNGAAPRYRYDTLYGKNTQSPYTGQDMLDEYRKFSDYYQIPFIDMSHGPINGMNLPNLLSDGVHPNEKGYKMLGNYIAAQIKTMVN